MVMILQELSGDSRLFSENNALGKQMAQLLRLLNNMAMFWRVVIYIFLATITITTFMQEPWLLGEPRGWGILALVVMLIIWYHFGCLWMMNGNRTTYYSRLDNGEIPQLHWRGILYWASLLAIVIALVTLNSNFAWMFWAVYGINFVIFPFPRVFLTLIPTIVILIIANGWLPTEAPPIGILEFVGEVGGFTIYGVIVYVPYMLIKARIHRERVFADLERSHQELEVAHTRLEAAHRQLAEASERDREIAVLRERERLARDMHDTLGHALVLANVKLEAALRLRAIDPARADHEIMVTQQVLRESMADLRASLANLRSPLVPRDELGAVLTRLATEAGARAAWDVTTDIASNPGELDERTYEALLRIGSEAITNAEQHAQARALWLNLRREHSVNGDLLVLRVSDDGIGISSSCSPKRESASSMMREDGRDDAGESMSRVTTTTTTTLTLHALPPAEVSSPAGHYGIMGMRERVTALGGELIISGRSGTSGTTVEARLPVHE
jgi:signal transduction histidine kinase